MNFPQISTPMRELVHPLIGLILPAEPQRATCEARAHELHTQYRLRTVDRLTPAPLLQIFRLAALLTRAMRVVLMITDLQASGNNPHFPPFQVLEFNFMKIYVALWKRSTEINELNPVHVVEGVMTWNCSLLRIRV